MRVAHFLTAVTFFVFAAVANAQVAYDQDFKTGRAGPR